MKFNLKNYWKIRWKIKNSKLFDQINLLHFKIRYYFHTNSNANSVDSVKWVLTPEFSIFSLLIFLQISFECISTKWLSYDFVSVEINEIVSSLFELDLFLKWMLGFPNLFEELFLEDENSEISFAQNYDICR